MVQRYDTILCTSSPAYNVEPVTNTSSSSSSSCANNGRRTPPWVLGSTLAAVRRSFIFHTSPLVRLTILFPSYSNRKCKKSPFLRTAAHIFVSPGNAPAIITQYFAWMERQFNACQTPRSMCLSIFNSFRVTRCLSQSVSPKIAIFTTFLFPLGRPWGNHAKCCMGRKRIRWLQIVSLHVPI